MAYATYTTEALVCGAFDSNTSDRSYLLFTRDAGMVRASARSVREERSKQRYALQEFSLVRVSLVRGKTGWRIGSATGEANVFTNAGAREARAGIVRVIKLLRQFLHGEEPAPALYDDARMALLALRDLSGSHAPGHIVELFTLRLLHKLGYIASEPMFERALTDSNWTDGAASLPAEATQAIERALSVSHL